MSENPNPVAQAALDYIAANRNPLPLRAFSKQPIAEAWQNMRVATDDVPSLFTEQGNIGLLLGDAGNGLIDVDLDSCEAIALAPEFLPATTFISGRPSKPRSHYWYQGAPVPQHRKFEFGVCLLELRTVGQTMAPPSLHPSGEQTTWHEATGEPPTVAADELSRATRELATASLILKHYPQQGSRHGFALALSGFLLRQGWDTERVRHLIAAVAQAANDEEIEDRRKAVETTAERLENGEPSLGGTRLQEIIGRDVFDKICAWLGVVRNRFEILPIVEAAKVEEEKIPDWPLDALEGDWISELVFRLFEGTAIPPQFLRESAVLVLGALIERKVGFPLHRDLHTRRFLTLVSERPQACKGESWRRIGGISPEGATLRPMLDAHGVKVLSGTGIGSGQYLAKKLEENPRSLLFYDEASQLFQTGGRENSTIFSALKSLFEGNEYHSGSFANKEHGTDDAHLSVLLHGTRRTCVEGFGLHGGVGDGLLSRFVLCYCDKTAVVPVWAERDFAAERSIVQRINELLLNSFVALTMDTAASEQLKEFARRILSPDFEHPDHARRLLEHMKVDCLMRAIFSGSTAITADMMTRSIAWGEHQLALRLALWPSDSASKVEQITQVVLKRLQRGFASLNDLRRAAHTDRSGAHESFSRAVSALRRSGALIVLGKNRKGREIFGLEPEDEEAQ